MSSLLVTVDLYDLTVIASARKPQRLKATKVDVRPQGTYISGDECRATFYGRDEWQVVIRA